MGAHVCPWWCARFSINNPLRRLVHDPEKIVGPYVRPGMFIMDVGCGVGWFSVPMAKMVGDQGRVIAVDLQQQMLDTLWRRAEKAGVTRPHQEAQVRAGSPGGRCPGRLCPGLCHGPRGAQSAPIVWRDPRLPQARREVAPR